MSKGENTKQLILATGLDMVGRLGLENISIGILAKAAGMSKSGLFAHFQSKENLQIAILQYAADQFSHHVVVPALRSAPGLPRIRSLVANWIAWSAEMAGGCIFVAASTEFSDRPGRVRDCLLKQQNDWIDTLQRIAESAIREGHFHPDMDRAQFAYDLYSLLLGYNYYDRLLRDPGIGSHQQNALERLLDHYRSAGAPAVGDPSPTNPTP